MVLRSEHRVKSENSKLSIRIINIPTYFWTETGFYKKISIKKI